MANSIKEIAAWLGIIGVPTIGALTMWCIKACVGFFKQLKILQEAQKAQMRGQLLDRYFIIKERGYIWSDEVDEWVNQYNAYHVLKGANAVLDTRKEELLRMPVRTR